MCDFCEFADWQTSEMICRQINRGLLYICMLLRLSFVILPNFCDCELPYEMNVDAMKIN